jgi:hypothetical protein
MKAFGYKKGSENLLELEEVSIQADIKELDKLIKFLQETKEKHSEVVKEVDKCHSHLRDWDSEWNVGTTDLIIVTTKNIDSESY